MSEDGYRPTRPGVGCLIAGFTIACWCGVVGGSFLTFLAYVVRICPHNMPAWCEAQSRAAAFSVFVRFVLPPAAVLVVLRLLPRSIRI